MSVRPLHFSIALNDLLANCLFSSYHAQAGIFSGSDGSVAVEKMVRCRLRSCHWWSRSDKRSYYPYTHEAD